MRKTKKQLEEEMAELKRKLDALLGNCEYYEALSVLSRHRPVDKHKEDE